MAYEPWQPGMILTASRLASISPTWQAWTPTWTTSSGLHLPSYGNATVDCAYAVSARTVFWRINIVFGSTTNFGTNADAADNWLFSLPINAPSLIENVGFVDLHGSGSARAVARARLITTGSFGLEIASGRPDAVVITSPGLVDSVSPWTWTSGMALRGQGVYEAAA
ncbi:hypothetical protein ACFW34_12160 [Streptomyces sp. NPDC058848]|uniref:hypothetical protein n=1 Tax=unclassified Streptomyces TaxID=2593676 RepID=UPI0036D06F6E